MKGNSARVHNLLFEKMEHIRGQGVPEQCSAFFLERGSCPGVKGCHWHSIQHLDLQSVHTQKLAIDIINGILKSQEAQPAAVRGMDEAQTCVH